MAAFLNNVQVPRIAPLQTGQTSMSIRLLAVVSATVLSACAEVENESYSTITLNGREYELRTRTMEGANGPYVTHSVRVNTGYRTCDPDSPGSCQAAIRNSRRGLNG